MKLKITALAIVLPRLAILLCHGAAHSHLAIGTNSWQTIFIASVIFVMPVIALVMVWTRMQQAGIFLLALSMAGSLVFGLAYHFIIAGPDNVASVNGAGWAGAFRATAVLLAVMEGFACGWSLWTLSRGTVQRSSLELLK